jgi:hypothetical protein
MRREGEVLLVYFNEKPTVFARIEEIRPDIKKDWYQVTLLLLTVPAQAVTWILRAAYIDGESFTMGGVPMRLEEVKKDVPEKPMEGPGDRRDDKSNGLESKVIPLNRERET